jgi:hypothetical protein
MSRRLEEVVLFLKKEPKNFYSSGLALPGKGRSQTYKSFLLLFFKKEVLASCSVLARHWAMSDEDLDHLITSLAASMALPLDPAHRAGVAANLRRLLAQAELVMSVPLPPGTEPAPIFRP